MDNPDENRDADNASAGKTLREGGASDSAEAAQHREAESEIGNRRRSGDSEPGRRHSDPRVVR